VVAMAREPFRVFSRGTSTRSLSRVRIVLLLIWGVNANHERESLDHSGKPTIRPGAVRRTESRTAIAKAWRPPSWIGKELRHIHEKEFYKDRMGFALNMQDQQDSA
jgi:hypothetical protein